MRALVLVGALCTRLAGDASRVQAATGARIGIIVQTLSGIGSQALIQKRYTINMFFCIEEFEKFMLLMVILSHN
jgi:hypothetical protein